MVLSVDYLQQVFLLSVRHSTVLFLVPPFGMRTLPVPVRLGLAVLLSTVIWPPGQKVGAMLPADGTFLLAVLAEVLTGGLVGFGISVIFSALRVAGALSDAQVGLGIAAVVDPGSGAQEGPIEGFYGILGSFVFLAADAHHQVVLALKQLATSVPAGAWMLEAASGERLVALTAAAVEGAVRLALPVVAVMLLTDVALALASRLVPQLQPFFVGAPLKIGLGLGVVLLTLPGWIALAGGALTGAPGQAIALLGSR